MQIRTNLDLVLDWLQGAGLGDIATEFFRKLSMAVNLLCVPRTSLLKASWSSLRTDHPTLTPAQLHHLLSHYQLGPGRGPPPAWDPPSAERDAVDTGGEKSGHRHWDCQLSLGPENLAIHSLLIRILDPNPFLLPGSKCWIPGYRILLQDTGVQPSASFPRKLPPSPRRPDSRPLHSKESVK